MYFFIFKVLFFSHSCKLLSEYLLSYRVPVALGTLPGSAHVDSDKSTAALVMARQREKTHTGCLVQLDVLLDLCLSNLGNNTDFCGFLFQCVTKMMSRTSETSFPVFMNACRTDILLLSQSLMKNLDKNKFSYLKMLCMSLSVVCIH